MKIKNVNTYKLSLLASAVVVYLLATGNTAWYLYVILGFIFVERAFIAFALWMVAKMQVELAKKVTDLLAEAAKAQGTTRPFGGGDIPPPTGPFDQFNDAA